MKYGELNLGQMEAIVNKLGGMDGVSRFLSGEIVVVLPKPELLLEPVGMITFPATTERFVASEKFVKDTSQNAPVKIGSVGNNFSRWFSEKTEDPRGETELRYQKLRKASRDLPIISELGGEERVETSLAEIYVLVERQGNGKKGVLLTDARANIFYVRDIDGILRAVFVDWRGWRGGWSVFASDVEDPRPWLEGDHVFSSNS